MTETEQTAVLIYILSFDPASCASALAEFKQYAWAKVIVIRTTALFESFFYTDLAETLAIEDDWKHKQYVGTLSWSAFTKEPCVKVRLNEFLENRDGTADVVSFLTEPTPMRYGDPHGIQSHPHFLRIWDKTLVKEIPQLREPFRTFYCNYWAARPSLVLEYGIWLKREFIPACLKTKRTLKDAKYNKGATTAMIKNGMCFYPHLPFLCERAAGAYFQVVTPAFVRCLFMSGGKDTI